ncbi:GNAT family N-acetyltransferase [Streptococcus sp. S784/96/1]|uniref:GNAT family N-acetyltransferase n=1 Tax=Streptococcus sp. S784/96/1 TaxID=2653499 RepID=UPI0013866020|nr:GNAT family N-acetyltransferase [Streptococcus sp. S784/96/1]
MLLRSIELKDNAEVATLIRTSLEEFGLDKPGTAYCDPQLDNLSAYYAHLDRSAYFVAEESGEIVGSGGFAPISENIAELQKLYVSSNQRGKGISSQLLKIIFAESKKEGYQKLYLETANELSSAVAVYEHFGFERLEKPLPNEAGHTAMDIWMLKSL